MSRMQDPICQAKTVGDWGRVTTVGYPESSTSTAPTTITATLIPVSRDSPRNSVTLWQVEVGRECSSMSDIQYAYVDPNTRSLYFLTVTGEVDSEGRSTGPIGFVTYDDDGIQINKLVLDKPITPLDFINRRTLATNTASDGSQLVDGMPLGNANNGLTVQFTYALTQKGGKRKTRRSKKSKK